MSLTDKFGVPAVLVGLTLVLQCAWIGILIVWGRAHFEQERRVLGAVRCAWLMVWIMADIVVLHVVEILMWGEFYRWKCFSSWGAAFYFSAGSFTTVGAGTLSLPTQWRTLQPLEGLTGVLMCGLSASFLFAVVTRLVEREETLLKAEEHTASSPHIAVPAEQAKSTGYSDRTQGAEAPMLATDAATARNAALMASNSLGSEKTYMGTDLH